MKRMLTILAAASVLATPIAASAEPTHRYTGHTRHYYRHCRPSHGTTGLLVGAGGGGLGAAALGAGPVGLAAGVIGGGLLGRHIDKRSRAAHNRRMGC